MNRAQKLLIEQMGQRAARRVLLLHPPSEIVAPCQQVTQAQGLKEPLASLSQSGRLLV